MSLAVLHRRLTTLMALAALVAFAAGAGAHSYMWAAGVGLVLALVWRPSEVAARGVERCGWTVAGVIFAAGLLVAVLRTDDYLPYTIAFLLVLLVTESLRSIGVRNEVRLYILSFAVLIASTAYYPGVVFASAFAAYIGFAALAMKVGFLRAKAEQFSVPDIPLRRRVLLYTAALSTVAILSSALVFMAFPRLPRGWIGSARAEAQTAMVGFGEGVSLGEFGGRIVANPEIVMRVEFDGPAPADPSQLRWRGRSYDHFDGVGWTRSHGILPPTVPPNSLESAWGSTEASYTIFGGPPGARVLFGLHPVVGMTPRSPIRPMLDRQGDIVYTGVGSPIYSVRSGTPAPNTDALRAAAGEEPAAAGWYVQLPRMPERVFTLADSLTRDAPTRYDAARAVESWLRSEFAYTLDLPATRSEATLEHFLFERRAGHCEYFSTAMAVLLRSVGVPTRNVNGLAGGEWNASGNYLAVTQNHAHSWVEVWFPGLGWVAFDPTPAAERNEVFGAHAGTSVVWPMILWWDGLQHRWRKWVLFYDLDKQLAIMRGLGDLVGGASGRSLGEPTLWLARRAAPWLAGTIVLAGLLLLVGRGGWVRRAARPESRLFARLRAAYARAGYCQADRPPLEFLEGLRSSQAPGFEAAAAATLLYLQTRFGPDEPSPGWQAALREQVKAATRELRRSKRRGPTPAPRSRFGPRARLQRTGQSSQERLPANAAAIRAAETTAGRSCPPAEPSDSRSSSD